jgi:hypothetical protein
MNKKMINLLNKRYLEIDKIGAGGYGDILLALDYKEY